MPKILLVEDNELNRDMLARRLIRKGYNLTLAVDGKDAIDKTIQVKPDIILMDMSLPILDGWKATKIIKETQNIKHIPIIALTAHAMQGDREKAFGVGCDDYDTKPIDFSRLLAKIEMLLDKKGCLSE